MRQAPTAAVLIIGDEILRGKVVDENAPFFARRLRELGVDLVRIVTVPDVLEVIAAEVRQLSAQVDHLFTSGGIGPTHDDMTLDAVAAAFGLPLEVEPALDALLAAHFGPRYNAAARRMATLPAGADLWWEGPIRYPLVVVRNVAIFPGVPSLLRSKFDAVAHRFTGSPMRSARMVSAQSEPEIADHLTAAAARWPAVSIGSYPQFDQRPHTVTITLDSRDEGALAEAAAHLRAALAAGLIG